MYTHDNKHTDDAARVPRQTHIKSKDNRTSDLPHYHIASKIQNPKLQSLSPHNMKRRDWSKLELELKLTPGTDIQADIRDAEHCTLDFKRIAIAEVWKSGCGACP